MIEFTKGYKTSDGEMLSTLEEAQKHELSILLRTKGDFNDSYYDPVIKFINNNRDVIIDILTTTPTSKPKARAINGGRKKRNNKTVITDANTSIGSSILNHPTDGLGLHIK